MERANLQNAAEALKIKEQVDVLTKGASMEPLLREHRDIAQISRAKPPFEKGLQRSMRHTVSAVPTKKPRLRYASIA